MPANSKAYNNAYAKKYMTKQRKAEKAKRMRDRYHYEKRNGKIPKNKELDHKKGVKFNSVRVISKSLNRSLGARKAIKRRKARSGRGGKY